MRVLCTGSHQSPEDEFTHPGPQSACGPDHAVWDLSPCFHLCFINLHLADRFPPCFASRQPQLEHLFPSPASLPALGRGPQAPTQLSELIVWATRHPSHTPTSLTRAWVSKSRPATLQNFITRTGSSKRTWVVARLPPGASPQAPLPARVPSLSLLPCPTSLSEHTDREPHC